MVCVCVCVQWNGKTCNKDEKFKAVQYLQTLKVSPAKWDILKTFDSSSYKSPLVACGIHLGNNGCMRHACQFIKKRGRPVVYTTATVKYNSGEGN